MTQQETEQLAAEAIEAKDYSEAVRLLQPLIEHNSEYALLTLGWINETGVIGTADEVTARNYYERAAKLGSGYAYFSLGRLFLSQEEVPQALAAFKAGAELNSDECKSEIERLTDQEHEHQAWQELEARNYTGAARLLYPLAERDSEYALLTLGWIYETERIKTSDKSVAYHYYERAAKKGSAYAYFRLGQLLLTQGEESRARIAFEAGAKHGHTPCMLRLGKMMLKGRGGPIDEETGFNWIQKAAVQGHLFALRNLLRLQASKAKSISKKLYILFKRLQTEKEIIKELYRDRESDNVR
jgi:uncharacterized protein